MAILPHYSPGYPGWDVAEQSRLLQLLRTRDDETMPAEMQVLETGMLSPKKSLLAVFGITAQLERVQRLTDLVPCASCPMQACQYRRTPNNYARSPNALELQP